jgi:hypothetical protein
MQVQEMALARTPGGCRSCQRSGRSALAVRCHRPPPRRPRAPAPPCPLCVAHKWPRPPGGALHRTLRRHWRLRRFWARRARRPCLQDQARQAAAAPAAGRRRRGWGCSRMRRRQLQQLLRQQRSRQQQAQQRQRQQSLQSRTQQELRSRALLRPPREPVPWPSRLLMRPVNSRVWCSAWRLPCPPTRTLSSA